MLFLSFKHFKPNAYQRDHFNKTLNFPVFTYNIELWYFSATVNDRKRLLKQFNRNKFSVDVESFVVERIHSIASNYASWDDHILNECYSCPRSQYLSLRIRTSRFSNSFIPTSIKFLNHTAIPRYHCICLWQNYQIESYLIFSSLISKLFKYGLCKNTHISLIAQTWCDIDKWQHQTALLWT